MRRYVSAAMVVLLAGVMVPWGIQDSSGASPLAPAPADVGEVSQGGGRADGETSASTAPSVHSDGLEAGPGATVTPRAGELTAGAFPGRDVAQGISGNAVGSLAGYTGRGDSDATSTQGAETADDANGRALFGDPPIDQEGDVPGSPPRALEQVADGVFRLRQPGVDLGFEFSPAVYGREQMRISVPKDAGSAISFHGPGAARVLLDGQPIEPGYRYPLNEGCTFTSPEAVGVHIRSGTNGAAGPDGTG